MRDGSRDDFAPARNIEPQLAELLRTCILPSNLFLRVANVCYIVTERPDASARNDSLLPLEIDHRYATKLLLSDGQLMIEALLHRKISALTEAADIRPGDLLDIRKFVVKKAKRTNGQGNVVCLGIEDCYFIKQDVKRLELSASMEDAAVQEERRHQPEVRKRGVQQMGGGADHLRSDTEEIQLPKKRPRLSSHAQETMHQIKSISGARHKRPRDPAPMSHLSDQDDFDDFEVLEADEQKATSRRKALQELDSNIVDSSSSTCNDTTGLPDQPFRPPPQVPVHAYQLSQLKYPADISHPPSEAPAVQHLTTLPPPQTVSKPLPAPPLHTLASLRTDKSLPAKNYAVTILAYISWTGTTLIHRPGSPFPPKRHAKLVDASLIKSRPVSRSEDKALSLPATLQQHNNAGSRPVSRNGPAINSSSTPRSSAIFTPQNSFQDAVTLAVFADAATFKPTAGTFALFRGIVMQRLGNGDVILNAYARIKEQGFSARGGEAGGAESWYLDDVDVIRALGYGTEVDTLRQWWEERQALA